MPALDAIAHLHYEYLCKNTHASVVELAFYLLPSIVFLQCYVGQHHYQGGHYLYYNLF